MSKGEELNELFTKWKRKQKNEKECENTIPIIKISKESFTYDGFVFEEKDGTVLYMLCESNLGVDIKANDEFWFKKVYKIRNNNLKIPKRIEKMQEYLCEEMSDLRKTDISYMNINKRGGVGSCNLNILKNYYEKYEEEILEEIKIINPRIIVFCARSKFIYNCLREKTDKKIIKMWHPSCRKSDNKYIEEFKERFKKM